MYFVMKVNISARRYHRQLNLSLEADFENVAQEDPQLIAYIREHHLRPPYKGRVHKGSHSAQPITELGEMFGWKVSSVRIDLVKPQCHNYELHTALYNVYYFNFD